MKSRILKVLSCLLFAVAISVCWATAQQTLDSGISVFNDLSPHKSAYVQVNSVRLNYLDWGGNGTPFILIHGIGDDAHIFDDLARLLRDQFHVLAYSRRGHGHSDAPVGPYDLPTLVTDLEQFMDSLNIQRAHLLGWSMGGNEITEFAARHPERVDKLIYLDSAYDWTDKTFLKTFGEILAANTPDDSVVASLDSYRAWYRAFWFGNIPWTSGLESYLRDSIRIATEGSIEPVPGGKVFEALFASLASPPRKYLKVRAPALALYAPTFYPVEHDDASRAKLLNQWEQRVMVPFRRASMDRVRRELKTVIIRQIPETCHMSIGVYKTDSLATTICEFLLSKRKN